MEDEFEEEELSLTESGMKTKDNDAERDERKTLLDIFVILLGNLQREGYENPS